jgi:GNAT superfamily N-acetyltransferase
MGEFELVAAADVLLMQGLAQKVTSTRPELVNADATFGELAWIWGHGRTAYRETWRRRLWFDDGELVAWGWAYLPHLVRRSDGSETPVTGTNQTYQVDPERPELLDEVIDWFDAVVPPGSDQTVLAGAADEFALVRWASHGYETDPGSLGDSGIWTQLNRRDLDTLQTPSLPEGFRFRTAQEAGPEAAAQAHIDAWHPSTFSLSAMQDTCETATYRSDLHVLVQAPDGTMVASAIMWLDEVNRTAEFEPVGTHRDYRRQGIASALLQHGMLLAREAGAREMTVACLGAPGYPKAKGLYYGVGFREFTRDAPLIKRAGQLLR